MPGQVTEMGFGHQPPASISDPVSLIYGQDSESNSPPSSFGMPGLGDVAQGIVDATGLNGNNGGMNGGLSPDTFVPFDPTDAGAPLIDVTPNISANDLDAYTKAVNPELAQRLIDLQAAKAAQAAQTEPCGLTMAEWQAHQAQMVADAAASKRQNMINLALAAGAGFVVSRLFK